MIEVYGINIMNIFQDETGREGVTPSYYGLKRADELKKGDGYGHGKISKVWEENGFTNIEIQYEQEEPTLHEYEYLDHDEYVNPETGDIINIDDKGNVL